MAVRNSIWCGNAQLNSLIRKKPEQKMRRKSKYSVPLRSGLYRKSGLKKWSTGLSVLKLRIYLKSDYLIF